MLQLKNLGHLIHLPLKCQLNRLTESSTLNTSWTHKFWLEMTAGTIHSTKIPTGPTGKSGPPQKVHVRTCVYGLLMGPKNQRKLICQRILKWTSSSHVSICDTFFCETLTTCDQNVSHSLSHFSCSVDFCQTGILPGSAVVSHWFKTTVGQRNC